MSFHRALACCAALLVAGLLSACKSAPEPQQLKLRDSGWDEFVTRLPRALGASFELEKRRASSGIPLRFRLRDAPLGGGRRRVVQDPYCGEMLEVFVRRLPPPAPDRVGSEEVLELDAKGDVARRWPIPPDKSVVGLEDDEILVPHGVALPDGRQLSVLLRIRPDGTFRVAPRGPELEAEPMACPESRGETPSEVGPQQRCWRLPEAADFRVLAYEGPCLSVRS